MNVTVRLARPEEYATIGDLCVQVYVEAGFVNADHFYVAHLRDASARAVGADLLAAVDDDGRVVGSVTYTEHDGSYAELSGPGEAEFRMLVVHRDARKNGVGAKLVDACLDLARRHGCQTVWLSSQASMTDAHRLYERLGFRRAPERDWRPLPDHDLLAYRLPL